MKLSLNVFFAISKDFIQHFTVAATSLLINNKDIAIKIFVLHDVLIAEDIHLTCKFFKETFNVTLNLICIGDIDFSIFRITDNYPKYTYFRLFLADIAPKEVETAIFLDADLVVTGSIRELAQLNPVNDSIHAVSEVSVADNVKRLNDLGFPVKNYFNAGVILMNLSKWREEKLSEKFIAIAEKHADDMEWVDQDILNIYFADNWVELDKKFNAIHLIRKLQQTPVIIHYASYSKPWHYVDTHPYNYLYQEYLKLTPFKNAKAPGFSINNFILKNGRLIKRSLREAGILSYK